MKPRVSTPASRGIALVITLVMLAVVTLMAITFLAVSRRERASVSVTEEQSTSRAMAQAGVERAKAEILSRVLSSGSPLDYDLMVSTNLINPLGFNPAISILAPGSLTNINYDYKPNRTALTSGERLQLISCLQLDARAPVYVKTNDAATAPLDFRFYLDLNRNGRFETNGVGPLMADDGNYLTPDGRETANILEAATNFFVGDPEWIGVTSYADLRHSPTNRFKGRYAYLVVPEGKTLDLNHIFNNVLSRNTTGLGYNRNQGVGSWELNLAAFIHDLHPALAPRYSYAKLPTPGGRDAAEVALGLLSYRYNNDYKLLEPARALFSGGAAVLRSNGIDDYSDGPPMVGYGPTPGRLDADAVDRPWPGGDNPNRFSDLTDLFDPRKIPAAWLKDLLAVQTRNASSNRYTFYRWMAQMGMDSAPANLGKINLNYDNRLDLMRDGSLLLPASKADQAVALSQWRSVSNLVAWTPLAFFTNVADRLLTSATLEVHYTNGFVVRTNFFLGDTGIRPGFSLTNIMVYPTNEYTASVHRVLQVAANLYDYSTNRSGTAYPYLPTVFQPLFRVVGTNVYISGYKELTDASLISRLTITRNDFTAPGPYGPLNPSLALHRARLAQQPDAVVYDVPLIIGAKKGFPNFNEMSVANIVELSRKIEVVKNLPNDPRPSQTNLMYLLAVSNRFGLEAWNSYTQAFPRSLRVVAAGNLAVTLTNYAALPDAPIGAPLYFTNVVYGNLPGAVIGPNGWLGRTFQLPVVTNSIVATNQVYLPSPRPHLAQVVSTNSVFVPNLGFFTPHIALLMTNRFFYALVDIQANRIVDFVCLGSMTNLLDVSSAIANVTQVPSRGNAPPEPVNVWLTNRVRGGTATTSPTQGILNQMDIALGNVTVSQTVWDSYNAQRGAEDKAKSIDRFRFFCGLTPLTYTDPKSQEQFQKEISRSANPAAMEAPYTPTRLLFQELSWQANDPLVHYMAQDVQEPMRTNFVDQVPPTPQMRQTLTNRNLGLLNTRFRPWGGNPRQSGDTNAYSMRLKDPMVRRSDDWDFPTNQGWAPYPNIGWIGRVHRGTPWQTVYLKAGSLQSRAEQAAWFAWSGSYGTNPTNDWNLAGLFTTALNSHAAQGLLSVNQTNLAAWSAVLTGVSVLTNTTPSYLARSNTVGFVEMAVPPDLAGYPQLREIVAGINRTRFFEALNNVQQGVGVSRFQSMGRILATPELTIASPFINTNNLLTDAIVERIPQQVLSLLREDQPRFTIYAFGQALKEAPGSISLSSGTYYQLCTNYQVKGEFATKAVIRLDGPVSRPRTVVESYSELAPE